MFSSLGMMLDFEADVEKRLELIWFLFRPLFSLWSRFRIMEYKNSCKVGYGYGKRFFKSLCDENPNVYYYL